MRCPVRLCGSPAPWACVARPGGSHGLHNYKSKPRTRLALLSSQNPDLLDAVIFPLLVIVLLNVLLLGCDIAKWNGNAGEKAKAA